VDVFKDGTMPVNIAGWSEPLALHGLSGSVPSDSTFTSYHKAPGSEREYAQVKQLADFSEAFPVYLSEFFFQVFNHGVTQASIDGYWYSTTMQSHITEHYEMEVCAYFCPCWAPGTGKPTPFSAQMLCK